MLRLLHKSDRHGCVNMTGASPRRASAHLQNKLKSTDLLHTLFKDKETHLFPLLQNETPFNQALVQEVPSKQSMTGDVSCILQGTPCLCKLWKVPVMLALLIHRTLVRHGLNKGLSSFSLTSLISRAWRVCPGLLQWQLLPPGTKTRKKKIYVALVPATAVSCAPRLHTSSKCREIYYKQKKKRVQGFNGNNKSSLTEKSWKTFFFLLDGTGLSRTVSVSSKDYICLKSDCIILAHTIR